MNPDDFFLGNSFNLFRFELIELTHSQWPTPLRYVRNDYDGLTVKHENGVTYNYEYRDFDIQRQNVKADLDQGFDIGVTDADDFIKSRINMITTREPVMFKYRSYRSDNLNFPLESPPAIPCQTFNYDAYGLVSFNANAKDLNSAKTGLIYTIANFPSIKAAIEI